MTELLNNFLTGSAAWGVLLTLAAFGLGALINRVTGKAIFNPLLLGSIFVIIFLSVCSIPYADYKASAAPVNYLLLPATVALAIPLYEKIDLLKENAAAIIAGISVGTLVSLGSALALALALDLTREQYATLLPKSVTTAISMDVAAELGGIAALTGAIVILTGIASISLLVGGIGIMNIMLVSVTERTREIGIRKALGAKERTILAQFVVEAATTSALGGVLGIALGYVMSMVANRVLPMFMTDTTVTVSPSFNSIVVAFGISVGIGVLFGYLPARRAARLNPIEALRYD